MSMIRVERHQLHDRYLDPFCLFSRNLSNCVNYLIRQEWINKKGFLNGYKLVAKFAAEGQPDYRALPANVSEKSSITTAQELEGVFQGEQCDGISIGG